jgi:protein TonB
MKVVNKLVVLASLGVLLPLASAMAAEPYLESSLKGSNVPVPVSVVSPGRVSPDYIGTKLELAFTVDATGTPTNLSVVSSPDALIAKVVMDAVKQWRFTPAQKNGSAVATKVVLPVVISGEDSRFAIN